MFPKSRGGNATTCTHLWTPMQVKLCDSLVPDWQDIIGYTATANVIYSGLHSHSNIIEVHVTRSLKWFRQCVVCVKTTTEFYRSIRK